MSHESFQEMAAGYALEALAGEERSRFEAHLRQGCRACETALRAHAESLAALAAELPPVAPPPGIKAALSERIAAERPIRAAGTERAPRVIEVSRPRWSAWPWALAGALAVAVLLLIGTLGVKITALRREVEQQRGQVAALKAQVAEQRELLAILRSPETQVVTLAGLRPTPNASGRMWWNPQSGGIFVANALPAAPPGKTYQLWAITGGRPVSAGVFDVNAQGAGGLRVQPQPGVQTVDTFAVTLEPTGGRPQPSGEMVLASK